jgi:hypothetical protein
VISHNKEEYRLIEPSTRGLTKVRGFQLKHAAPISETSTKAWT